MPVFPVFPAATQIRDGENATHLHPREPTDREAGRQRDVESAVTREQRRVVAVQGDPLAARDEHRHASAVLAVIERLACFVGVGIDGRVRRPEQFALSGHHVVSVDRRRRREARERVERLRVTRPSREPGRRADARKRHVADETAVLVVDSHPRPRVFQVRCDEQVMHEANARKRVLPVRDYLAVTGGLRPAYVHLDKPPSWRVAIRLEVEQRPVGPDEAVLVLEVRDEVRRSRVRLLQVSIDDPVLAVRPFPDRDHEVSPVVGHARAEPPLRMVGRLVHEDVLRLRCPDAVIAELLVQVHVLVGVTFGRRVVATVEEATSVLGPCRPAELHPSHFVAQDVPRLRLHHAPRMPIRTSLRDPVRHVATVVAEARARERDRAVVRPRVRVDEHPPFALESVVRVQHALIL